MKKIRALIIDDEANARQAIRSLLQQLHPEVDIVGEAANATEAVTQITELSPDTLFVDIHMPGKTGIQLLEEIGSEKFNVIFVTAYHDYALKAFRLCAIDYLLKPIDPEELSAAIKKIQSRQQGLSPEHLSLLESTLKNLQPAQSNPSRVQRLALSTSEGVHFIDVKEIIWCESMGGYTKFHLLTKPPVIVSKTIKEYEEMLQPFGFIRVHQSSIVNLEQVTRYVRGEGGQVWMSNGVEIEVSRRKKEEFMQALSKVNINPS